MNKTPDERGLFEQLLRSSDSHSNRIRRQRLDQTSGRLAYADFYTVSLGRTEVPDPSLNELVRDRSEETIWQTSIPTFKVPARLRR